MTSAHSLTVLLLTLNWNSSPFPPQVTCNNPQRSGGILNGCKVPLGALASKEIPTVPVSLALT